MSSPTKEALVPEAADPPDPKRWLALVVVITASFMDLLDVTIVNVAVPSIQSDLGASYAAVQWVTAGYTLGFAAGLITGGRLGDIYGRRRMLILGITGFTIASLLCGVATSPGMLITARLVQGIASAVMIPQVIAIIHVTFPAHERGKVLGVYGAIGGLALVSGPILGGIFIDADLFGLDWRPIFLVNVPIGILGIFTALAVIRESKSPNPMRPDVVGVILASATIGMFVYPLVQGHELDWPAWAFVMLAGSLVLFVVFIAYERMLTARGGSPLIVLSLFNSRSFTGGFSVNLLFNVGFGAFFLMWTLFMQIGLGWSAIHAGLTGIPFFVGMAAAAGMAVQMLTPKFGRNVLFAGGFLMILGSLLFVFVSDRYGTDISSAHMIAPLFVIGLGMGYVIATVIDFALSDVPHEHAGAGSGAFNTTQQLGNSVGIAIIGVIFLSALPGQSSAGVDFAEPGIRQDFAAVGITEQVQDDILAGYRVCAEERAEETDPTVVPESCLAGPPSGVSAAQAADVERIIQEHTPDVQAETFSRAFRIGMYAIAGLFVLVTLLMVMMPKFARPQEV
ncbi:MFS transporter [Streptomyces litchfieldiae]|uniref:MFS transporter n=1 Tax=Streptomyces litchfieldiae TaxID=3075543 RepID=A0ABU2MWD9_9ACTN|nr:MFS transporter [Streptomyces sp. DSM 44938]MDT0345820.1 MFS transporter [Streptomyces sp. DSM 44938]